MSFLRFLVGVLGQEAEEAPRVRPAGPPPRPGRVVELAPEARQAILRLAEARSPGTPARALPPAVRTRLLDFASTGAGLAQLERDLVAAGAWQGWRPALGLRLGELPPLPYEALTRLLVAMGTFDPTRPGWGFGSWDVSLAHLRRTTEQDFDLADVLEVVAATGTAPDIGARELLLGWRGLAAALPVEALVAWYAAHPDVLAQALGAAEVPADRPSWPRYRDPRPGALRLLSAMEALPEELVDPLWELALGDARTHRDLAQRCLESHPDTGERLESAVGHPRQAARAEAAAWLARRGQAGAAPALRARAKRERSDRARDALLSALEVLGESIEEFFDAEDLAEEAAKKLAKLEGKLPPWVLPPALPEVRWAASGEAMHPDCLRLLLARAHKLKSAEPGAELRRWASRWTPETRRALGQALLAGWIRADELERRDVSLPETVEADLPWYQAREPDVPAALLRRRLIEEYGAVLDRSAIADKGLLAVVAACSGVEAVEPTRRYIRRWYGQRAPQCKELLRMLGWIEADEATQLILQIASRFRTRGIQKVAEGVARELAARRGWTRAELADRLVPTGGLAADGTRTLDYGPRQLEAFLDEAGDLWVRDEVGKIRKDAPRPRQSDDPIKAEAARKAFAHARKIRKRTLATETERLYAAMATERTWVVENWRRDLLGHPLVGRLVRRIVWEVVGEGRTFLVGPEDELLDAAGAGVSVRSLARVRVAHGSRLELAAQAGWARAFEECGREPLLAQFRAAEHVPAREERQEDGWHGRRGWVLGSYALRARARRLGYQRGPTGDGGRVHDVRKALPELGLDVVLEHSGVRLPEEEDMPVALVVLRFVPRDGEAAMGGWAPPLPLSEVPEVLLHEAIADVQELAATGAYDEDWEARLA